MKYPVSVLAISLFLLVGACCAQQLVIYAVDSLLTYPPYNFTRAFEIKAGLPEGSVILVRLSDGDLATVITQTNLNPVPDVVIGLDNIHGFNIPQSTFLPVVPTALVNINKDLYARLSRFNLFPYEYGRVTLIANTTRIGKKYDPNALTLSSLAVSPDILRKTIVQDPVTSVTGAAFMLATVATYGDPEVGVVGETTNQGDWRQWWKKVLPYSAVTSSWSSSWAKFSESDEYELIISYELDQVYNYCASGATDILAIDLGGDLWYLIQALGVYNGTRNETLALQFVDWFLSPDIQTLIPDHEWMYPSVNNVSLPACFEGKFASPDPTFNERLNVTTLVQNIPKWEKDWHTILNAAATSTSTSTTGSSSASIVVVVGPFIAFVAFVCMIFV